MAEMLGACRKARRSRRPVDLVAGEGVEIAIQVLDVDRQMHRALAAIDHHRDAARMGKPRDFLHRRDGAQHVRHMGDGDHLRARRQRCLEILEAEFVFRRHRHPFQHRAVPLALEMPGHDIGMVLHDRQHDLVALADPHPAEGVRNQIDRLGGVLGEDDLCRRRR